MAVRNPRLTLRFLVMLVPALLLVAFVFMYVLDNLERQSLGENFHHAAKLLVESLEDPLVDSLRNPNDVNIDRILKRVPRDPRVVALIVCDPQGKLLKRVPVPLNIDCSFSDRPASFKSYGEAPVYQSAFAVPSGGGPVLAQVIVVQSVTDGPGARGAITRRALLLAFFFFVSLASVVSIVLYRWNASRRLDRFGRALKRIIKGDGGRLSELFEATEFAPLVKDLNRVIQDLVRRRKPEVLAGSSNPDAVLLREEARRLFGKSQICVVANREPYIHNRKGKKIEVVRPASGLVTAMEPIMRACSGMWIGHGSGSADRESADRHGIILVPPEQPEYSLKRVWLSREEENGYYYGFSNEGLWPLCHIAHTRPTFRKSDWKAYVKVNEKFASAFAEEMKTVAPIALIQDYHFACLPEMIRKRRPDAVVSLFWHIPWPNPESIRICPWKQELLEGMLGADLIGFHIQYHCNNFLDAVDTFLEARVDRENFTVTMKGHTSYIRPFPISIDWPSQVEPAPETFPSLRTQLLEDLGIAQDSVVAVGVDRLDYTKGIVERLQAVEVLLDNHPELVGKFVLIQISAPSRAQIKRYQELDFEVKELALRINGRFQRNGYEPIMLRTSHHDSHEVMRYYRAADLCVVTSLHDGMNLVAKEFIASRSDLGGALVLSSFTGAARELTEAYVVNPYDTEEVAEAMYRAISADVPERQRRMKWMRNLVSQNNVYDWARKFLVEVHRISELRQMPSGAAG
jgi:trehalose-6-phosphate synthase